MAFGFTTKSIDFSNPLASVSLNIGPMITKAQIVNLDSNEVYKLLFNPTEVKKAPIEAVYEQHKIAFRSHPKLQYNYTSGVEWMFQLYLSATSSNGQNVLNILSTSRNLNNDVAFLESLVYPIEGTGLKNRRPPRCRFVMSDICNVPVKVKSVGTAYTKFNFRLQQQITMVDVVLIEDPDATLTSNRVRANGSTGRPGLLGAALDKLPKGFADAVDKIESFI